MLSVAAGSMQQMTGTTDLKHIQSSSKQEIAEVDRLLFELLGRCDGRHIGGYCCLKALTKGLCVLRRVVQRTSGCERSKTRTQRGYAVGKAVIYL